MSTRYRLIFFALSLALVTGLGRWQTGGFAFLTGDFWYVSGVLLLVLLSLIDQPHFSTNANVFVNGVAGLVALTAVSPESRSGFWTLFFVWSFYLTASSYGLMLIRSQPLQKEGATVRLLTRLNRSIGRPDAIFSAFFIWGIIAQFGPDSSQFRTLLLFWGVFIVLNVPSLATALSELFTRREQSDSTSFGRITKVISPRIVEVQIRHDASLELVGRRTTVNADGKSCAHGTIIDDRIMAQVRLVTVAVTETTDSWSSVARVDGRPAELCLQPLDDNPPAKPISFVDRGSNIGTLRCYLNPQTELQEGDVVTVRVPSVGSTYYQAVAAEITQERSEPPHLIQEVRVSASQLGIWIADGARFEPIQWVPPAGELVHRVSAVQYNERHIPEGHALVGNVPRTDFPVHVHLNDGVTHNTAIIGVTGSGKSYLSFHLVERLVSRGIKVLVLDVTRQHWTFLHGLNPTQIRSDAELRAWLQSESLLGVHQFANAQSYPARTADYSEIVFRHYEAAIQLRAGINEPARLCVVLEEAHSLIPEWNQVAVEDDKRQVNRTARVILQGRKYGLGCIVITQRTANVTKTILNQCNTIFAMQSFDQTGLEFLRNYMGDEYAGALSTLPPRHSILVGKASSSARPILFRVADLSDRWVVPPVGAAATAEATGLSLHGDADGPAAAAL